ncbi:MAG: UDP-N-acetylmuramate dehydrogenase, partial [Ostreibacterium sp.]
VFDLQTKQFSELTKSDCQFNYRDSIFKHKENRQHYLITAVTLCLSKKFTPILSYQGLINNEVPKTSKQLVERVITARQSKLPDPHLLPNAGSFFKNPIIPLTQLKKLQQIYPQLPYFTIDDEYVKVPAAWLLQTAGFKGEKRENGAGVYEKHALILVNHDRAQGREIYALACDMMDKIKEQFSIIITPEVRIIGIN